MPLATIAPLMQPATCAGMYAKAPRQVSSRASPVSSGESYWAAMPAPITTAARNAEPRYSASSRRASGGFTLARR